MGIINCTQIPKTCRKQYALHAPKPGHWVLLIQLISSRDEPLGSLGKVSAKSHLFFRHHGVLEQGRIFPPGSSQDAASHMGITNPLPKWADGRDDSGTAQSVLNTSYGTRPASMRAFKLFSWSKTACGDREWKALLVMHCAKQWWGHTSENKSIAQLSILNQVEKRCEHKDSHTLSLLLRAAVPFPPLWYLQNLPQGLLAV